MTDFVDFLKDDNFINEGDVVYVISDMMPLALEYKNNGQKLDLDNVINGLKDIVGSSGTLLFPTFNWDFCKGIPFDYHNTPSKTGALSKAALKRPDFRRTLHPLYSFAVWGKKADELLSINVPNSFGKGTIFDKMTEYDAKALVIGVPALSGFTYIHHVEKLVGVPYRYEKNFTADYIDPAGNASQRTYSMYVRDLEMDPKHINGFEPLEKLMHKDGIIRQINFGNVLCSFMNVNDTYEPIRKDIEENDSKNMYIYNH